MKQRLLGILAAMACSGSVCAQEAYEPGTVLVTSPAEYQFAGVEIASAIKGGEPVESSFIQAAKIARTQPNVAGVLAVDISADSAIERGRVACYSKSGEKKWEERVLFNMGGNAERIAEKYATRLAKKVKGKTCP